MMSLIACAGRDLGIGKEGRLLFNIPEDMAYFKRMTLGKTVVMGRKTLESLPGGKPLKGRENVVLSRSPGYAVPGAAVCGSPEEFAEKYKYREVFVIGGAQIYRLLAPYCVYAYITLVDAAAPADARLPDLDRLGGWRLKEASAPLSYNGMDYIRKTYFNTGVKNI